MNGEIRRKYSLFEAICMVVGIVIGSGIFFKVPKVFLANDGGLLGALSSVGLVGIVVLTVALSFSTLGEVYPVGDGLIGIAEVAIGPRFAYFLGWFTATVYYPTLTCALARVSAGYIFSLLGITSIWGEPLLAVIILFAVFALNTFFPTLTARLGVSATIIKLIPLLLLAILGTAVGISGGGLAEHITGGGVSGFSLNSVTAGAVAFAFAYEGWIATASLSGEIKNPKKSLPIAIVGGLSIVLLVYLGYTLGIGGVLSSEEIISSGDSLALSAFTSLFGSPTTGRLIYIFILISCLGTTLGLSLAASRGMLLLAERGWGPCPQRFYCPDEKTRAPIASSAVGLLISLIWLLQWEAGFVHRLLPPLLSFEPDELPIITLYAAYIPLLLSLILRGKRLGSFRRFVRPVLASLSALFMLYAAILSYKLEVIYYLIIFALIMLIGLPFYRGRRGRLSESAN